MSKFHINPKTGKPGRCVAKNKCKYSVDGVTPKHYDTFEEAASDYEKANKNNSFSTLTKDADTITDPYTLKYLTDDAYEATESLNEKFALINYGVGGDGVKNNIDNKAIRKIEEYFSSEKYLDYDMVRATVVKNSNGSNDIYLSDENMSYINGKLNVPDEELIKVSRILNVRRALFDNGWGASGVGRNVKGLSLKQNRSESEVDLLEINEKFTDGEIEDIADLARNKNMGARELSRAREIIKAEDKEKADRLINIFTTDSEEHGYNNFAEDSKEFFNEVYNYAAAARNR